ncbi:MAG: phosphate propanoyltransferase [Acidaminococcales bacterium]|nr:phosphate propanoyltransferase [Acidaminococcales bacterium]
MERMIKLGISARHIHLDRGAMDVLFGKDSQLHKIKDLGQPGDFTSEEKVDLISEKAILRGLRVIGPLRKQTQIELAMADARALGLNPPLRDSGNLKGSAGIKIIGPDGELTIPEGVIIAERHIHLDLPTAAAFGLKDGEHVRIRVPGVRPVVFEAVLVRAKANYAPEFHIDTDEGNACFAKNGEMVEIIG